MVFLAVANLDKIATRQPPRAKIHPRILVRRQIYNAIVETLNELGIPNAKFSIADTTILIRDGYYIGRSFVCGHVRVVILSAGERIEFFDRAGNIIQVICLNSSLDVRGEAA